ncbi:MAG: hypothetical protein FJY55_14745 [Betaproteobacteria bacterium]|nr:hypothetical protein [Betaproteobacteria bacterium]
MRKMSKLCSMVLAASAVMAMAPASFAQAPQVFTFKYASDSPPPENNPYTAAQDAWMVEVEKKSNGRIKFSRFWAQTLVPSADQLRAVGAGIADVTTILSGFWPADIPLSNVAWLPGVTTDSWSGMMALRDLVKKHPAFMQELEVRNKIKYMTGSAVGPAGLITTRPVRTLDDLKGMKIISIAGPLSDWLKALGAVAVFIPAPERYDALSRKTVDGFTGQPINISVFRYYEPAKYYIDSFLGSGSHYIAMNLSSWNRLPQDLKRIIEETETYGIEVAARKFQYEGYPQKINDVMKPAGVQFTDPSPADVVRAKKVAREVVWEKWIRDNEAKKLPAREIFNDFVLQYKKYEAASPFKGQFPPSVLD